MSDFFDPDVLKLVANRKKIEAIKLLRERTGLGLSEAKQLVEQMAKDRLGAEVEKRMPKRIQAMRQPPRPTADPPQPSYNVEPSQERYGLGPGEIPTSGNNLVTGVALLMILVFSLFYLFSRG